MTDTPLTIQWYNLSSSSDDILVAAFDEFRLQLTTHDPQLPAPQFSPLSSRLIDQLPAYLISMLPGSGDNEGFADHQARTIFVYCEGHEEFAAAYREHNELAHWGVAIPCTLAIAWEMNKHLVWHELLHLLNAKDCYNKFGINKCPNERCLMRRAPSRDNCGDRLTLCSKNVKRVQRFAVDAQHALVD